MVIDLKTKKKQLVDVREVQQAIQTILQPAQVFEIRVLDGKTVDNKYRPYTYAGYFKNTDESINILLHELMNITSCMGIYFTPQVANEQLLHRIHQTLQIVDKDYSTANKDITRITWLLIDSDPTRIAYISSTNEEHEKALQHSLSIKNYLQELGFPDPIKADSGNGAHLMYPLDLPNEEEITAKDTGLIPRFLQALDEQFSQDGIKVDISVGNAARIWKLYGTMACKGSDTPERPHRMARILEVPEQLQVVDKDLLEKLAIPSQLTPEKQQTKAKLDKLTSTVELKYLETFLKKYDVPYDLEQGNPTKLILTNGCVFDESHKGKDAAIIISSKGGWKYHCFHDSCAKRTWQELRTLFEPDAYQDDKEKKVSVAKVLLEMSAPFVEVFCDNGGIKYARVPVRGHHETMIIGENGAFRLWLHHLYEQTTGTIPNTNAVSDVIRTYSARALFQEEAKVQEVYLRTAYVEATNTIYLDMADSKHQVIEITGNGWQIVEKAPVIFRRTPNMAPLPIPIRGGSVEELRPFINCKDEEWPLIKAWVHGCLQPAGLEFGEYAILNLTGGQGAAKTSAAKRLRSVFDPSIAPLRKAPKDAQAFAIMAHNNFVVGLDNLSHISNDLSDSMCTLSTGAGDAYRTLYTDADETVFVAKRPQVITGIEQLATRGDLLDRCLLVSLQDIPDDARITSSDLNKQYKDAHPRILGAFLDCVSLALRERDNVHEKELPRLADFAKFVLAAHPLLFQETEDFLAIYKTNREEGVTNEIEASPVAAAVLRLMQGTETYTDTAENLLAELARRTDDKITKSKLWPLTPRGLSAQLTRLSRSLRQVGIFIKKGKSNGERNIILTRIADSGANSGAKSDDRDAKSETGTQNSNDRDAKSDDRDAKKELCATEQPQEISDNMPTGTQSGANNPSFLPLAEEENKKEENEESQKIEKDITEESAGNLRHFAPLPQQKDVNDELLDTLLARLDTLVSPEELLMLKIAGEKKEVRYSYYRQQIMLIAQKDIHAALQSVRAKVALYTNREERQG